jgi:hypothetical protein
MIPMN